MSAAAAGRPRPAFEEEWLVAVLDSLSEGVIALGDDGRILAANPASEQLLGFHISEQRYHDWETLSWRELCDEDEAALPDDEHPVAATLDDGRPRPPRVVGLRRPDGMKWLALATHVLPGDVVDRGVVVSFQDVTERIRAEHEVRRVVSVLRDFMAATSHDLRSPVTAILGFAEVLEGRWGELTDARRRNAVDVITRQAQHVNRLVDDLSMVARLEAGGLQPRAEDIEVRELVHAILNGAVDLDQVHIDVPDRLRVWADRDHVRRMLVNLVDNAAKYGRPPFEIRGAAEQGSVELSVTDHGPGVPSEFAPQLFDRFTRASSQSEGGSGLGLAIVAGLAARNGGEVRHESVEPHGARFALRLPQANGEQRN